MLNIWKKRNLNQNSQKAKELSQELKLSPLTSQLLVNRGIENSKEARVFLWPEIGDLNSPEKLPDIKKAVERIKRAIANDDLITVYGDYDADGTVATAILVRYLRELGAMVNFYIPNRIHEGYGLNMQAIDKLAARGTELIITVDNGISALDEADYIKELGIDLIVTDHHEPGEELPQALSVIDCKRKDSSYPFNELCGAGIAYKLVEALENEFQTGIDLEEYLQMATVSTVADLVPLEKENRTIAKLGIESVNKNGFINKGLKRLYEKAELESLNSYSIGFRIGPMINAPGRLGFVNEVMALLLSDDDTVIEEKADLLYDTNVNRTSIEKSILNEAIKKVQDEKLYEDEVIVVSGKGWHPGVIGIVASKIQDKWYKPVIVISVDENGKGKGSCRSIEGFNIHEALTQAQDYLESFGGHEQAAGLSVDIRQLENLKTELNSYARKVNIQELLKRKLYYDLTIEASKIKPEYIKELDNFEPTGIGNPAPMFKVKSHNIQNVRQIGKEKNHLSFSADNIRAIGFGLGEDYPEEILSPVTFLAKPEINCYNNSKSIQYKVKDIHENPFISYRASSKILNNSYTRQDLLDYLEPYGKPTRVSRKLLIYLYKLIEKHQSFPIKHFLNNTGESVFTLIACLKILQEAQLINYSIVNNTVNASIVPTTHKQDLTKTKTYRILMDED